MWFVDKEILTVLRILGVNVLSGRGLVCCAQFGLNFWSLVLVSVAKNCQKMFSKTANDQYSLMEFEPAGLVHTMMVVDPACIPRRFNLGGLLRPWKFPLKDVLECGLARNLSQYFGFSGSVLMQHFYNIACYCIRCIVIGVGNVRTERAKKWPNLELLCPALVRHANPDWLVDMVLHFGIALAAEASWLTWNLGIWFIGTWNAASSWNTIVGLTCRCQSWTVSCGSVSGYPVGTISRCCKKRYRLCWFHRPVAVIARTFLTKTPALVHKTGWWALSNPYGAVLVIMACHQVTC